MSAGAHRRTPKAHLLSDPGLHNEYLIAKELHMTHKRLVRELGRGEQAYWLAVFEIDNERFRRSREEAEKNAKSAARERSMVPGRWHPTPK